ncbi:LacI family DNA-binding transcriptional regulator [Psychrosphaera aquimarina]|uniref:LacI family DNA-binding transcriptional regulator n=1 Tax=Psychrosphaera aquimarina TaxID=2044854 RepID=A0ABU3R456_9GAMM|nr:LacI family DNA-binding transcriptional regulator [Psychrosphaera aquimarina]MDU0114460.1 LacI family DNA-binding transcriptional regulator [Psychrosphaera aquimarina]
MKGKATSFDIAYEAGVSQSTVSRALRHSPLVSEETRKKIQEIAKKLNYTVDKNASSLRSQTSTTLALLLFEDPTSDDSLVNPFFLSMLGSITRECGLMGYDLLVSFQELNTDWHSVFKDSNKADGLILLGYGDYTDYESKLRELVDHGTPFVRWGAATESIETTSIGCDNNHGSQQITEHLIKLGRKSFAFVGNAGDGSPEFMARYQGHCESLKKAGIDVNTELQADAGNTAEEAYDATITLLDKNIPFDAVVAASDVIALGVLNALKTRGLTVPDDVSLVGFDDIPMASYMSPSLTTCRQDSAMAGQLLVDKLVELIKGEPVSNAFIKTKLIVRESCGAKA